MAGTETDMPVPVITSTLGFIRCATFECWHTAGAQTNVAAWNTAAV